MSGPSEGRNIELVLSSANYLFKYLNQQLGMSYDQLKNQRIDLKTILEHCRFYLVRRKEVLTGGDVTSSQPFQLEDFEKLRLLKILKDPDLEMDVETFMNQNSLELEFSGEAFGEGVSS